MAERAIPFAELFDPAFLAAIERLRLLANRVPAGGRPADQRSKKLGSGLEFHDHRPYAAGDDLRSVDWNLYQRLGKVFVRLFEENEDLPVYLLPDVSRSAWVESPPRALAGLRATLGLGAIALGNHDKVGVFPFGAQLQTLWRPQSGARRVQSLAQALSTLEPAGGTAIAPALEEFGRRNLRRGLAVVISDLFDPAGAESVARALSELRHSLIVVQLVRASDREPDLSGDLRLVDCESGAAEDVSVTPQVVSRYREAYDRFQDIIAAALRARGAGHLRLDVEGDVAHQLSALFQGEALVV